MEIAGLFRRWDHLHHLLVGHPLLATMGKGVDKGTAPEVGATASPPHKSCTDWSTAFFLEYRH